jgi:hypothetical protein
MSKYLLLAVLLAAGALTGNLALKSFANAKASAVASAKASAYSAGCVDGISEVLPMFGATPKQDALDAHCAQAAAEYLKR